MNSYNDQTNAFGALVTEADYFATCHKMAVLHDTYDGANDHILRWRSKKGLDCDIVLSDLRVPHEGLRLQAFARQPKSSALNSFYYVGIPERIFPVENGASFNTLLEMSRVWAESKQLIQYTKNNPISLSPIFEALKNREPRQRYVAAMTLTQVKDVSAVEPLIAALDDDDSRVRTFAITALAKQGDARAVKPLLHYLEFGHQGDRVGTARALGLIRDKAAVESLILSLGDNDNEVRLAAIEALSNIGSIDAVAPLIAVFDTGDEITQIASAKALGQIADPRAIETLQKHLLYSYQPLRSVIAEAINSITSKANK